MDKRFDTVMRLHPRKLKKIFTKVIRGGHVSRGWRERRRFRRALHRAVRLIEKAYGA